MARAWREEYKLKYAVAAIESGYTLSEIGENIGMSAAAIRDMLNGYILRMGGYKGTIAPAISFPLVYWQFNIVII